MRHAAGIAGAALLAGCGGAEGDGSAGAAAADVPERSAEVTVAIGALDGPEEHVFGRVAGTALGDGGRIFVADMQAGVVRAYGPDGAHLFDAGRPGQGPGELENPCCLAFGPEGLLWVRDGGNARYTAYRLHGADSASFADQLPMVHGDVNRIAPTTFRGDSLVDVGFRNEERRTDGGVAMRSLGLHRAFVPLDGSEPRWEPVDEVPMEELGVRAVTRTAGSSRTTFYVYPVHGPIHRVAHGPGGRWAEVVTDRYRVTLHDPDRGTVTLELRTPEGPTLSDAERERAREQVERYRSLLGSDFPEEAGRIPERKQPLTGLFFDAGGRLWVERTVADGAPRAADVWSPAGELVERRSWPAEVALGGGDALREGTGLGVATDSMGVHTVVGVEWPAGG